MPTIKDVRRIVVIALTLFAFAGSAAAAKFVATASDGTLSVKTADGVVWIRADGAVVGRFDGGELRIVDPVDGDPVEVTVWGDDRTERTRVDGVRTYFGDGIHDVRFRVIGVFRFRAIGTGISLSAVGQGRVGLEGDSGTYSFDGKRSRLMPFDEDGKLSFFDLGETTPGP